MTVILFIAVIGIIYFLNWKYMKTYHYKMEMRKIKVFLEEIPKQLSVINLGSSYARFGFDYEQADSKGCNFAIQPQSLSYDYKILKQYKDYMAFGCKVLIILPVFAFSFLDYSNDRSNTKYYYFLKKEYINNYSPIKYLFRVKLPLFSSIWNLYFILKNPVEKNYFDCDTYCSSRGEAQNEAIKRINEWKKQFKLKDVITIDSIKHLQEEFQKTQKLVREMIDYCIYNGWKPIIIIPPVSKELNSCISEEVVNALLYENIEKVNEKQIPVLDYLYDSRFQDYRLYSNADFLNKAGRKIFTHTVLKDIKLI